MADQNPKDDPGESKEVETTLPVYLNTHGRPPIGRVYLYRVINHNKVLAYEINRKRKIAYDALPGQIDTFLSEINNNQHGPGTLGLGSLPWIGRNYFVVVYEDSDSLVRGNAASFTYADNSTNLAFDNGMDIPSTGEVRRFFCINHIKKKDGGDLGHDSEQFEVMIHHGGGTSREHTATGTNTGPP